MNVTILASGSKSNSMIIEIGGQFVMVDAGLNYRDTVTRMMEAGIDPENLSAILVTHSHGDHTDGLMPLTKKVDVPVYMSAGCADALKKLPRRTLSFQPGQSFKIGKLTVGTFEVPHDAAQPVGFSIVDGSTKFAMATDLGSVPEAMVRAFDGADILALESNHDVDLAQLGDKHPAVLKRVLGPLGHLSNAACAQFLKRGLPGTSRVILTHLSSEDNDRVLCRLTAADAIKGNCELVIAQAQGGVE